MTATRRRTRRRLRAAAVARKVRELRRLVPGGEAVPADRLLLHAAGYVAELRARVELLRALAALLTCAAHAADDGVDIVRRGPGGADMEVDSRDDTLPGAWSGSSSVGVGRHVPVSHDSPNI
uniref:BHLH domain-containing protein n=1 Tax=Oryza punctata TaxID=4537 RepID=A0A0E0M0L9_ORYPU